MDTNREVRPKRNKKIVYKLPGDNTWRTGKVSSVGKKGGAEKFRCWIKSGADGTESSFDFVKDVVCWKYCGVNFDKESKDDADTSRVVT